ncbi:MAG: outer membrane lipoprotein chaperone LolA [Gammaproteobacteria bacterium]|nr:outer membrane lipoprotein chaperone LolA [Gammaproteobacteria bacterium]
MFRVVFFVLVLGIGQHAAAAKAGVALQAFLDGASSVAAQFEQNLFDDAGKLIETSTGFMVLRRPDQFRWHYAQPFEQQIIADGEKIWIYDPDLQQVSVKPMGRTIGGSPAILLSSDRRITELFEVRDLDPAKGLDWVELIPRETDSAFTALRVGMRDGVLAAMTLADTFGQRTELSFHDVRRNQALPEDTFDFVPPPGADVLEEQWSPPQ